MRKSRAGLVIVGVLAALVAQGAERPFLVPLERLEPIENAALPWIQQNARPFAHDIPSSAELAPLLEGLRSARVIGIGEATHGDRQCQGFKAQLIRELIRQGRVDTLMLELNRKTGVALDAFVNQGQGDLVDVALNQGVFEIWRNDEFVSLLAWMRAWVLRTGKPIRVYGVDCQDFEGDMDYALKFLERYDRGNARKWRAAMPEIADLLKSEVNFLQWLQTKSREDYLRLERTTKEVIARFEARRSAWSKHNGFESAFYAARTALQNLRSFELEMTGAKVDINKLPSEYLARRDVYMGENLMELLGDGRAAFWAHDSHVISELPPLARLSGARSVGGEVRTKLKDQYVSIGFVWTRGAFNARIVTSWSDIAAASGQPLVAHTLSNERRGDLGEFFNRVGPSRFIVDFRRAPAEVQRWGKLVYFRGWCGWAVQPEAWQTVAAADAAPPLPTHDILVYFREISPSTLWALPKK